MGLAVLSAACRARGASKSAGFFHLLAKGCLVCYWALAMPHRQMGANDAIDVLSYLKLFL